MFLFHCLCTCQYLILHVSVYLPVSASVFVCLCVTVCVFCACLFLSLFVSLHVSVCACDSVGLCVSDCVSVWLCIGLLHRVPLKTTGRSLKDAQMGLIDKNVLHV